jgi:DNA-binding transcriptional LysR family regulator
MVLPPGDVDARTHELDFRATSLSTLAQMVAAGAGVTLLPRLAVASESRHAALGHPSARRRTGLPHARALLAPDLAARANPAGSRGSDSSAGRGRDQRPPPAALKRTLARALRVFT